MYFPDDDTKSKTFENNKEITQKKHSYLISHFCSSYTYTHTDTQTQTHIYDYIEGQN